MNAPRESRLATMLVAGGIVMAASLVITALGLLLPWFWILGPIFFVVGLALVAASVFGGIAHNRQVGGSQNYREAPMAFVVARFAINHIGEMIFANFDEDAPEARYYVRLRFPDGHDEELECAFPVCAQAGEGMFGDATIQGRWLGAFVPRPRPVGPQWPVA
jgi:hypothetical protein